MRARVDHRPTLHSRCRVDREVERDTLLLEYSVQSTVADSRLDNHIEIRLCAEHRNGQQRKGDGEYDGA